MSLEYLENSRCFIFQEISEWRGNSGTYHLISEISEWGENSGTYHKLSHKTLQNPSIEFYFLLVYVLPHY